MTLVNATGANAYSSQHYFAAISSYPNADWTEYVGFVQGWGSPNGTSGAPAKMHANVRYLRPMILANYSGQPGIVDIDTIEWTEYDWPSAAGLYLTPLYSGYWTGSAWRSYFDSGGNFYLNAGAGSNFLSWNGTTLTINGAIVIQAGSSGIGSFSDAGALATANSAAWGSQVSGRPTELTDGRIPAAINASGIVVSRVDPGVNWGANPGAGYAGLLLGGDYMGYWTGTAWRTYMDNAGRFYVNAGAGSNYMSWDGTTLTVSGAINVVGGNAATTTYVDTGLGGKANTSLNNSGISTLINGASIRVGSGTKNTNLTGWNIDSGEIVAQENGVTQVQFNTSSGIGLIANNTEPTAPAMRTIEWGTAFPVTSSNLVASIRSYYDAWNQIAVTAHNLSTTRGARTRFGNRINGTFSAGFRITSSYVGGVWNHSIDAYGNIVANNNLNVYGSTYVGNLDSTGAVGSAWTALTLTSPWGNSGAGWATAQYCRFGDWVVLRGLVTPSSNQAANATILTLDASLRPTVHQKFATTANNVGCSLDVLSTGIVRVSAAVNTGQVVSINCVYKR